MQKNFLSTYLAYHDDGMKLAKVTVKWMTYVLNTLYSRDLKKITCI